MRYYSINRPILPGGYPRNLNPTNIVNFDQKTFCEDIGEEAWGYIEFDSCISTEEADAWEFVMAGMRTWYCVTSSVYDDGRITAAITSSVRSDKKPETMSKSLSRKDIYTDWFDDRGEAEAFCKASRGASKKEEPEE